MTARFVSLFTWLSARYWRLGLIVAVWSLLVTLFVQLIVLGLFFPEWSDGHGLIRGEDSPNFHRVAVEQAARIRESGWQEWQLRPKGWGVSGLISIWYALIWPEPWALAPVQALIYGLCAALIARMVDAVSGNRLLAAAAVLPIVLLPSSALLYARPHRDLYVFLGFMLAIWGWHLLALMQQYRGGARLARLAFSSALAVGAGIWIAWAVRQYSIYIFEGIAGLALILLLVFAGLRFWHLGRLSPAMLLSPALALVLLIAINGFHHRYYDGQNFVQPLSTQAASTSGGHRQWERTEWLPAKLDERFSGVASARNRFIRLFGGSRSAVGEEIVFRDAGELFAFTPHALRLGFLSPFPRQWLPDARAPAHRNLYRVLAGGEMLFAYLILPFFFYAAWRWWYRPAFWILSLPAIAWIMVYAFTVPAVGSIFRYRYGAYMIILAISVAGAGAFLIRWRGRHRPPALGSADAAQ